MIDSGVQMKSLCFWLAVLSSAYSQNEYFGPSPHTGFCYMAYKGGKKLFNDARSVCAAVQHRMPAVTAENSQIEIDYWTGEADKIFGIDASTFFEGSIWLGYKESSTQGDYRDIETNEALPYLNFYKLEQYDFNNLLLVSKFNGWQMATYPDSLALYVVCQYQAGCQSTAIPNGQITKTGLTTGTVTCDAGYEPRNSTATCVCPIYWSESYCELSTSTVSCPSLTIANGAVTSSPTLPGNDVEVKCNSAYAIQGSVNRATCNSNGQWATPVPQCVTTSVSGQCSLADMVVSNGVAIYENMDPKLQYDLSTTTIPSGQIIYVYCNVAYQNSLGTDDYVPNKCSNGQWNSTITCTRSRLRYGLRGHEARGICGNKWPKWLNQRCGWFDAKTSALTNGPCDLRTNRHCPFHRDRAKATKNYNFCSCLVPAMTG